MVEQSEQKNKRQFLWIALSILVFLSFSFPLGLSSPWSSFFPTGFIHKGYRGLDFYQVPNGAHSLFHGGGISTEKFSGPENWASSKVSNKNVYHPAFTIIVGGFLQLFNPPKAEWIWHAVKLAFAFFLYWMLYRRFSDHPNFMLATLLYFCNIIHFHEIQILQYQSIANAFLLLFLLFEGENKPVRSTFSFVGTLLTKPFVISFPFFLALRKRKIWEPLAPLALFALLTLPFFFFESYQFFFDNLKSRAIADHIRVSTDFVSMRTLFLHWHRSLPWITVLKFVSLALIALMAWKKKTSILTLLFFLTVHWLCFDSMIYEYHFSALIPFFVLGLLREGEWSLPSVKFLVIWASLPSPYILFKWLNWELMENTQMLFPSWTIYILWKFVPLFLLCGVLAMHGSKKNNI